VAVVAAFLLIWSPWSGADTTPDSTRSPSPRATSLTLGTSQSSPTAVPTTGQLVPGQVSSSPERPTTEYTPPAPASTLTAPTVAPQPTAASPNPTTAPTPAPVDPLHRTPPAYRVHCTTAAVCFVVGPNIYCEHYVKNFVTFTLECVSPATPLGLGITPDWRLRCSGTWGNYTGLDCQHTLDGGFSCGRSWALDDSTTECFGDTWNGSCADSQTAISCYRTDSAGQELLDCTTAPDSGLWFPDLCTWANALSFSCEHAGGDFPFACRPYAPGAAPNARTCSKTIAGSLRRSVNGEAGR